LHQQLILVPIGGWAVNFRHHNINLSWRAMKQFKVLFQCAIFELRYSCIGAEDWSSRYMKELVSGDAPLLMHWDS
jgi:hypothetical protein